LHLRIPEDKLQLRNILKMNKKHF